MRSLNEYDVIRGWNEELHYLYSSTNPCRVTKSRRMGWARFKTNMGEKINADGKSSLK
jgi:hypothetical protein